MATLSELNDKFTGTPEPAKWSVGGRSNLLLHVFYNVLNMPQPRNTAKNTLPALNAQTMGKWEHPLAHQVLQWRSDSVEVKSFLGSQQYLFDSGLFAGEYIQGQTKAVLSFNPMGYDIVERIFSRRDVSIPLNLTKEARNSFVLDGTLPEVNLYEVVQAHPGNLLLLSPEIVDNASQGNEDLVSLVNWTVEALQRVHLTHTKEQLLDLPEVRGLLSYLSANPTTLPAEIYMGFDWAQAELYMLTLFSGDSALKEALYSSDVHRYVAKILFGTLDGNYNGKTPRELAKTIQFALIYSSFDPNTAAYQLMTQTGAPMHFCREVIAVYVRQFGILYQWVRKALDDWRNADGVVTYFMGARKRIEVPEYMKPASVDKLGQNYNGRVAINTYGQNSVGLLLKTVLNTLSSSEVCEDVKGIIPVFDALYFTAPSTKVYEIYRAVDEAATPALEHGGFTVRFKTEWKVSSKSWGAMKEAHAVNDILFKDQDMQQRDASAAVRFSW